LHGVRQALCGRPRPHYRVRPPAGIVLWCEGDLVNGAILRCS
jgi:hypothetical protein